LSTIECAVAIVKPVQLTQIFLVALSLESYELTQSDPSVLENWFVSGEPILRQSATYSFSRHWNTSHSLKSFQYRLVMVEPVSQGYASAGNTKFLISMQVDQDNSGIYSHDYNSSHSSELGIEIDKEGIEIDESFLAGSVLRSTSCHSRATSPHEIIPELSFLSKSWNGLVMSHMEDYTVHVRTFDLGRVGLLNGDWVRNSR
jgi:peroxin-6